MIATTGLLDDLISVATSDPMQTRIRARSQHATCEYPLARQPVGPAPADLSLALTKYCVEREIEVKRSRPTNAPARGWIDIFTDGTYIIYLADDMRGLERAHTLAHEVGHTLMAAPDFHSDEVQAELFAFAVSTMFGAEVTVPAAEFIAIHMFRGANPDLVAVCKALASFSAALT